LCNHNDYQNIAVNGGDSGNTWGNIHALSRKQKDDYPLIMFLELVGNDVCAKSFNSMTTEVHFKENILKLLNYLDTTVPAGSHLMILGLADGELLYDNLHDWTHPLNVTYADVYDFLNCLKISPCWGWLNTNETVRRFTTERAQNLSKVYQQIISEGYTFKNFDLVYYDFPAMEILERKVMEGGDPKDMIERCDGFHPNGEFHSDLGDWLWNKIQTQHPEWVGPKNPFNDQIRKMFGHAVVN
jgi:acyloxyacyl hydrolase